MQRARRLASTAVVAALVVGGLSACQAEPEVAAYVGSLGTIATAEVARIYDQAEDKLTESRDALLLKQQQQQPAGASAEPLPPVQMPFKQQDVLNTLLTLDILEQVAATHHVQPAAKPTVADITEATGFSPEWEYTGLYTRTYQLRAALSEAVPPGELTDAELRSVYDKLHAAAPSDLPPFEQFKSQLSEADQKTLEQSLGLRDEVAKVVEAEDVKPNPRYGTQELDLLSARPNNTLVPLVTAPLAAEGTQAPFVASGP
ncbi:hypothetical protein [Actinoplanes sp. NPDC026623]|uniref:hypothetical protein n=1 Tax=Actinoplanes sp. NPDC026623 TaxID=3155610 RepID=UPI00340DD6ED